MSPFSQSKYLISIHWDYKNQYHLQVKSVLHSWFLLFLSITFRIITTIDILNIINIKFWMRNRNVCLVQKFPFFYSLPSYKMWYSSVLLASYWFTSSSPLHLRLTKTKKENEWFQITQYSIRVTNRFSNWRGKKYRFLHRAFVYRCFVNILMPAL